VIEPGYSAGRGGGGRVIFWRTVSFEFAACANMTDLLEYAKVTIGHRSSIYTESLTED